MKWNRRILALLITAILLVSAAGIPVAAVRFADVAANAWYAASVQSAYELGLMEGTSSAKFTPMGTATRAMVAQVLYRISGEPDASAAGFSDVNENDWFYRAVNWAAQVGVTHGISARRFAPNMKITREAMATMLCRYTTMQRYPDSGPETALEKFSDAKAVSDWAEKALCWAVTQEIMQGVSRTQMDPAGACTRAQLAAILVRYTEFLERSKTFDVEKGSLTMQLGDELALPVVSYGADLQFVSSDEGTVSVSEDGVATANKWGTAAITVSDRREGGGLPKTITVVVAAQKNTIAYVPLDDRPVNTDRVIHASKTLPFHLVLPEHSAFQTVIGAYTGGADQYGSPAALAQFLADAEAGGVRRYVISLDQLYSGGLMSDRVLTDEIPDEVLAQCQQVLARLCADPGNQIILLDSVQRLATSCDYHGYNLTSYNATRAYAMQPRPEISYDDMTVENHRDKLEETFHGYTDGVKPLEDARITERDYLASRMRNLTLTTETLEIVAQAAAQVYYYVGIDDSSTSDNIQSNEIAYLEALMRTLGIAERTYNIKFGIDELGVTAIAKLANQDYETAEARSRGEEGGAQGLRICVQPFGDLSNITDSFSSVNARKLLDETLEDFSCVVVDRPKRADICILIYSSDGSLTEATAQYRQNMQDGRYTVVIDMSVGERLGRELTEHMEDYSISCLLAYSSWNTLANRLGVGVMEGIARYYAIAAAGLNDVSRASFAKGLISDFVIDVGYQTMCGRKLDQQVLNQCAAAFDGKQLADFTIQEPSVGTCVQPWHRNFEARVEILMAGIAAEPPLKIPAAA